MSADDVTLAAVLRRDDEAEEAGMHANDRSTCWSCQSWADHAHDPVTSRRMSMDEFAGQWGHLQRVPFRGVQHERVVER